MLGVIVLVSVVTVALANPLLPDDPKQLDERIVGGQDGKIEQFPYQVSLRTRTGLHFCGGSIYKSNLVITASHCVIGDFPEDIIVVAGTDSKTLGGIRRNVKEIVMHPKFNNPRKENDVALLLLENHFEFSTKIQPIGLIARNKELRAGIRSFVSGWGTLKYSGSTKDTLQWVAVTLVDKEKCMEAYKDHRIKIQEDMMCAGEEYGGRDACQGDSGGPLMVENKLIGIVSWGEECARSGYPGVYASVAVQREWIEENAKILEEK